MNDGEIQSAGQDRAIVLDILNIASKIPRFPVERNVNVEQLSGIRKMSRTRISWSAIFARAYGLTSREQPKLRQLYVAWPWPRFFQSPQCVLTLAVNRQMAEGDERLFFGRIFSPDIRPLVSIQSDIDHFKFDDPASTFRSQWRGAKLPAPIRHAMWWWRMNIDYKQRPRRMGTGSISALGGQGVTNRSHPTILTTSLSFSPIDVDGNCLVTLVCDHRIIDGVAAATALNRLCELLNTQVLQELTSLAKVEVNTVARKAV